MPLITILTQAQARLGINLSDAQGRIILYQFLNQATRELNEQTDLFGSLAELAMPIYAPAKLTFPSNVASLRGVRWNVDKNLYTIRPVSAKYTHENWKNAWRNFTPLGFAATERGFSVSGPLTIETTGIDSPVAQLVVVGKTVKSGRAQEIITLSSERQTTVNSYADEINSLVRVSVGTHDIVVKDSAGNQLARIENNQRQARYLVVDIGEFPQISETGSSDCARIADCLVKLTLPEFSMDYEELPFQGFDDIIVDKMEYLLRKQEGKTDIATALYSVIRDRLQQLQQHLTGAEQTVIDFAPHPHDYIQPRPYVQYYQIRR